MDPILNYINGEYVKPSSNDYIDVIDPAIGEKYTEVANSDKNDIDKAVYAAEESFLGWSALSIKDRSNFLTQIANEFGYGTFSGTPRQFKGATDSDYRFPSKNK